MKKWLNIKQQIIALILTVTILVGLVGFLTYRQLTRVLTVVTESSQPNLQITYARQTIFDLSRAENYVKTYTLTNDSMYVEQYRVYKQRINGTLEKLTLIAPDNPGNKADIDSLLTLVDNKFDILDELLVLQNEFRVEDALEKVARTFDTVSGNTGETSSDENKGFFSRLRSRKKAEQAVPEQASIHKNIRQITAEEATKEEIQLERELQLLISDKQNMIRIQQILDHLESSDAQRARINAVKVSEAVSTTKLQIVLFIIVICLLLLFMTISIIQYIAKGNRYRKVLRKAKREAESLASAKEHFVATVSHEIRTPVNIISGFAEQLSQSKLTEKQSEQLTAIMSASGHLLSLINEVLDFTKIRNNKLTLEQKGFAPGDVIREVCESLLNIAHSGQLKLEWELDDSIPPVVVGDAYRLRQILLNIISNAVKFTPSGTISVTATTLLRDKNTTRLRIVVRDTGIGMSTQQLQKAFSEFEQAEASTTRKYGGTGLGLSITRQLIELQGGSIELESAEGEGTTVTVEIPYMLGNEELLARDREEQPEPGDLSGKSILVVDDEAYNRKLLLTILEKFNATVTEASNGKEAVEEVLKNPYDLILMDARMPEMNGIEAAAMILQQLPNVPIVALTAAVTSEDRELYAAAGMKSVLPKPYREYELLSTILPLLFPDIHAEIPGAQSSATKENTLDFGDLRQLSGSDNSFYREMLDIFIDGTKSGMHDLGKAIERQDILAVEHLAHRLSSPCKHISAEVLYQHLKSIEYNASNGQTFTEIERLYAEARAEAEAILLIVEDELKDLRAGSL